MSYFVQQSSTGRPLLFLMVSSTDHISPVTGLTPTVTISKAGAAFASPAGAVTEVANGWYKVAGNATDTATLGPLILHATGTGADVCDVMFHVCAFNPDDAVRLGLTSIPNAATGTAGALLVDGTGTAAISNASGKVLLQATQTGVTIPTVTTLTNTVTVGTNNDKTGYSLSIAPPTSAQIATAVWQDTTAGDFTVASSIGKSLYTSGNSPGAASGLAIVGSNVGTATSVSGAVGSVTGNVGGNVVGSVGSVATSGITRSSFAVDTGLQTIRSNTAQAGASTSITLDSGASSVNDFYKNALIYITGGTGVGQSRFCTAYVGATKVATVSAWATNPDATSTFAVIEFDAIPGAVAPTAVAIRTEMDTNSTQLAKLGTPAGVSISADIAAVNAKTTNLPASPASTTNITGGTITTVTNLTNLPSIPANWITAAGIATDAIGSAQLAASAVTEIQTGLATSTVQTNQGVQLTWLQNFLGGDKLIDTTVTPWAEVVRIAGTGTELIRKKLRDVSGTNITTTTVVIGSAKDA